MTTQSILLLVAFLAVLLAAGYPLGLYMARVAGDGPCAAWAGCKSWKTCCTAGPAFPPTRPWAGKAMPSP